MNFDVAFETITRQSVRNMYIRKMRRKLKLLRNAPREKEKESESERVRWNGRKEND